MSGASQGFIIDLRNFKDRRGSRLPEGEYLVRVDDAELVETKAGDPMVNLFYVVVGGACDGSALVDRLVLKDASLWRAVAFLQAVGVPTPKKNLNIPFKLIVGRTLLVTVEDGEPYNGQTKSEIRGYANAKAGSTAPKAEAPENPDAPEETAAEEPETVDVDAPETVDADAPEEVSLDLDDAETVQL